MEVLGSAYTRAFSRLSNVIKQSIIKCPNDGNVASMPESCHNYLLLLEGRERGCCTVLNPMCHALNSTGWVVKNGVLQFFMDESTSPAQGSAIAQLQVSVKRVISPTGRCSCVTKSGLLCTPECVWQYWLPVSK